MRVALGSPASLISTADFSPRRMYEPSFRRVSLAVRTMTALATSPFFTWPVGIASLMATTTVSPRPAYRRLLPPRTRMTRARRAPELSAMRSMLSCWTMLLRPLHDLRHPPRHRLGQRAGLHDPHRVARLGALLVPRLHLLGPGDLLPVHRMGIPSDQRDRDSLLHFVAGDHT